MKTAVIYARYSCDNQTEQSIEGQLRVCEEYAEKNDILILNTYIDRAMTGTNDNRPEFQQMIRDSAKKEWNYVLVYKLDRFSRNKYESVIHKKTLKDNGVKIISCMENIPDTPEGIILESLLEGMNQYYSAELAQKVKRGMHETRLKGYFQGGTLLYGYKLDGRKIVPNEEEKEVVKYIYEQYKCGTYIKDIIKTLKEKGITKRGKSFSKTCIYNMLRNEKYIGIYIHEEERILDMYPQILPNELFESVRKKINSNKYGRTSVKADFLLRHKVKCGYCGENINGESGTMKNGKRMYYYKCNGRKQRINTCNKSIIKKEVLEDAVINTIIEELSKPKNIDIIVNNLMKCQENLNKENANLIILEKEQKQTQNSLNNMVKAIEMGVINKTTNKRMTELEDKLELLEKQILIEKNKNTIKVSEKEIRDYFIDALKLKSKLLISYLIKEIKLYDDKIHITFNSPLKKGPDENQDFLFCKKIKDIKVLDKVIIKMLIEIFI